MRAAAKKTPRVGQERSRTRVASGRRKSAAVDGKLDVRDRILRASQVLIEREGLSALSMREVARRAGVSHQAPYNHFADREAILGAIAEEGFVMLRDRLREVIAGSAQETPLRIRAGTRAYVEFAVQYPAHFRLMFRPELVDLENCPGAKAEGDNAFQLFTDVVLEGVRQGLPAEPSLEALIALGWSVGHGLACLILDGPLARKLPHAQREAMIDGVTEAFSAMVRARMAEGRRHGTP